MPKIGNSRLKWSRIMTYIDAINRYLKIAEASGSSLGLQEAGAFLMMTRLANQPKWNGVFSIDDKSLAERLGISNNTLRKLIANLVIAGVITVSKGKGNRPSTYNGFVV